MTDIILNTITSGYNISKINSNFDTIKNSINDDVLNLSDGNNIMLQDIDLNSHDLLNVNKVSTTSMTINGTPVTPTTLGSLGPDVVGTTQIIDGAVTEAKIDPAYSTTLAKSADLASTAVGKGSKLIAFIQRITGAVSRWVEDKLSESISVFDFMTSAQIADVQANTALLDVTSAVQAAADACHNNGNKLKFPIGTYSVGTLIYSDGDVWEGESKTKTILQLRAGKNQDLLQSSGAPALFGTNSNGGVIAPAIRRMTLDGNSANNTSGKCLSFYGWSPDFEDLYIINAPTNSIHSEGGPGSPGVAGVGLEGSFRRITCKLSGEHGVLFGGPHDSVMDNVIHLGAGQKAHNTYDSFQFYGSGIAKLIACHGYSSTATNSRYALNDNCGGLVLIGGDYEGAATANAIFNSNTMGVTLVDPTARFYSQTGTKNVIINKQIVFHGNLGNAYSGTNTYGITLGTSPGVGPSNSLIDAQVFGCSLGAVDFTNSQGANNVRVRGYQPSGPAYVGMPKPQDVVDVIIGGATYTTSFLSTGMVTSSVVASGTNQSTATQLAQITFQDVSSVAVGSGCKLPGSIPGMGPISIVNLSANALLIYPPSGSQINLLGTNVPMSIPSGKSAIFACTRATQWIGTLGS